MENRNHMNLTKRRSFIGNLTAGAFAMGMLSALAPLKIQANDAENSKITKPEEDPDTWFSKIKGKHRIVYDVTHPEGIFPFAWPRVFLITNEKTGTPASDCGVVVILRHTAIGYAFDHSIWEKYPFGEIFKVDDPATKIASKINPFWKPPKGTYKLPGVGEVMIGIDELQADGVMFCVCDAAITVFSAKIADKMKMDETVVKKDWLRGLLPNVQVVPSGVWAVGRAQEHKCAYCFVGE